MNAARTLHHSNAARWAATVLYLGSLLAAPASQAAVVFDTLLNVDDTGGPVVYWDQAHPNVSSPGQRVGTSFSVASDGLFLSSVSVRLSVDSLVANLRVSLHEDAAGRPASAALEVMATDPVLAGGLQTVTLPSIARPILHAGVPYWIVLEPSTPDTVDGSNDARYVWQDGVVPLSLPVASSYYDETAGAWQPWSAFSTARQPGLQVEAIPEASTIAMTLSGLAILAGWHHRRRRAEATATGR